LALLAMSLSVLVIANDFSAVNVAIPTMEKDFSPAASTVFSAQGSFVDGIEAGFLIALFFVGGRLFGRTPADPIRSGTA
jgi:hypothetical protein